MCSEMDRLAQVASTNDIAARRNDMMPLDRMEAGEAVKSWLMSPQSR